MSPGRAPPTRAGVLRSSTRLPHCVSRHSVRCVRELDRIAVSVRRTGRSCLRPAGWSVHRRHARRRSMKGLAGVAVVVVPRRAADGGYQAGRLDDVASPSSSRVHCHRCTPHDTSSAIFLSTMSTPGPSTTPSRMASLWRPTILDGPVRPDQVADVDVPRRATLGCRQTSGHAGRSHWGDQAASRRRRIGSRGSLSRNRTDNVPAVRWCTLRGRRSR